MDPRSFRRSVKKAKEQRPLPHYGDIEEPLYPPPPPSNKTPAKKFSPPPALGKIIPLPQADTIGSIPLEQLLHGRRSHRSFSQRVVELEKISQILWAAQGITDSEGRRTAPSAGATYPLELFAIALQDDLSVPKGVHRYRAKTHDLLQTEGDRPFEELPDAAYGQGFVTQASILLGIGAVYDRTTDRYPVAGIGFVCMEAGHAAQNVYLQSTALSLNTVAVGAFNDREVARILNLPPEIIPLYLMPLGYPLGE